MRHIRFVFSLLALLAISVSCAKKAEEGGTSLVSFQLPGRIGNGALSGNYHECYAISVRGPGITSTAAGTCDPAYGEFKGLVAPSSQIQLGVTIGKDRVFELYYVYSDQSCAQLEKSKPDLGKFFGANKVFLVGKTQVAKIDSKNNVVQLNIQYPASTNSLRSVYGYPNTCDKGEDPIFPSNRSLARLIQGRLTNVSNQGTEVQIRLVDRKMDLKSNTGSNYIVPSVRLGESQ